MAIRDQQILNYYQIESLPKRRIFIDLTIFLKMVNNLVDGDLVS